MKQILLSLLVHCVSILALSWWIKAPAPLSLHVLKPAVTWLEVERPVVKKAAPLVGGGKKALVKAIDLADLAPAWSKDVLRSSLLLGTRQETGGGTLLDPTFVGGSAEELLVSKTFNLERWVYQRIESILTFPNELYTKKMSGEIVARLKWNREGQWIESQSQIEGSNRYLRLHVRRVLRTALAQDLPEHLKWRLLEGSLGMDARFVFALIENHDADLARSKKGFGLKNLFFYRSVHSTVTQWEVGPFSGIFPIPTVGFNPFWVYEKIKNAVSNDAKLDVLDRYRDDPDF